MNSSINVSEIEGTDFVEVEMIDAQQMEEDEEEMSSQEYTSLMPMQPLDEDVCKMIETGNYSGLHSYSAEQSTSKPSEEEVIPTIYVEDEDLGLTAVEDTDQETEDPLGDLYSKHHKEKKIIDKLLEDSMSFSEVAQLLGEDTEDSDAEGTSISSTKMTSGDEDHAAAFEKELSEQQRYHLKRKGGKEKRRRRRLPAALQGLMGEANLRYARCEYDEAIKMCMEVIRQYSYSPEPYQTLGMIYEEKKDTNKSLQFLLMAAFLSPNAEEWEKLADLSIHQLGDLRQAVFCWGRAIRANPQNLDYHWARCDLLELLGEKTKALKGYMHMLKYLRPEQGKDGLKLAKEISKIHFENGDFHLAQETMETAFKKYPSYVTAEDTNLMLEVLMQRKEYLSCITILLDHMGLSLKSKRLPESAFQSLSLEEQVKKATACHLPNEFPLDLKAKLAISFIHLQQEKLTPPIVDVIMTESAEEFGDLYFDVAEAYSKTDNHKKALELLKPLLSSKKYSDAAVWLLYGECLAACDMLEEAADAYAKVVVLAQGAPQRAEARLTLSSILQSLGRADDALHILNQENELDSVDSQLLYRQCKILLEQNQTDDFVATAKLLFKRHFVQIRSREEAEAVLSNKKISNKYEAIREIRKGQREPTEDQGPEYTGEDIPIQEQWELFQQVCHILYDKKRFEELERLTFSALGSKDFMRDRDRAREVEFICLLACIYNESFYFAYNIMRELATRQPENVRCWNLLCLIISKADDFRHNRFLIRLTLKNPDSIPLGILNGHNCLVAGTYKFSLAEYTHAFKQDSNNPLIPLLLGLTYTHMACQKFSGKKHSLVVQACSFLNTYVEMRKECQESLYNLGRAMHQLNLLPQAIYYYKKALTMPIPSAGDGPDLDLSREIAFNIALIYKNSRAYDVARMYIKKYIVI